MTPNTAHDGLEIPDFLKVTPEESARRKIWNDAHPVVASQFIQDRPPLSAEDRATLEAIELNRKAAEKVKRENRVVRKELVTAQDRAISDGKVWRNGQWVDPEAMVRSKACRIMRDLPTDKHRAIFMDLYGGNVVGGPPKLKNGIWK